MEQVGKKRYSKHLRITNHRKPEEVKQLLEQAKLDGDKMQIKIWTDVLRTLEARKEKKHD